MNNLNQAERSVLDSNAVMGLYDCPNATKNLSVDTSPSRQYINFMPNALFSYTLSRNRILRLQYWARLSAPSLTQLQPVVGNANPLNTRLINPTLQQEHYNTVTLTYNASSSLDGRNFLSVATSLTPTSKTCGAGFFHSISWSASCITTINLGFNLWWFDT